MDLSIGYGLPAGWKLFYSAGANSDELVREHFPSLAFNSTVRVYFEGGIRSSRNQYFSFELPRLVVEGDNPTLDVYCETARLTPDTDGRYSIPNDIIRPGRLSLEVKHQDVVLAKRNIFVDDNVPVSQSSSFSGNRFAQMFQSQPGDASICGAIALGQAPPYNVVFLPEAKGEPRVIFIGRIPGQIAFLGADERPQAWAPVWAIVMHRRGKAIFCGSDIHDASPIENESNDKRSVQEWKRILWHRRKRIAPPSHEGLQRLWSSYQERAKTL